MRGFNENIRKAISSQRSDILAAMLGGAVGSYAMSIGGQVLREMIDNAEKMQNADFHQLIADSDMQYQELPNFLEFGHYTLDCIFPELDCSKISDVFAFGDSHVTLASIPRFVEQVNRLAEGVDRSKSLLLLNGDIFEALVNGKPFAMVESDKIKAVSDFIGTFAATAYNVGNHDSRFEFLQRYYEMLPDTVRAKLRFTQGLELEAPYYGRNKILLDIGHGHLVYAFKGGAGDTPAGQVFKNNLILGKPFLMLGDLLHKLNTDKEWLWALNTILLNNPEGYNPYFNYLKAKHANSENKVISVLSHIHRSYNIELGNIHAINTGDWPGALHLKFNDKGYEANALSIEHGKLMQRSLIPQEA